MKCMNVWILIACCMSVSVTPAKHVVFEIDDVLFEVKETESLKGVPGLSSLGEKLAATYTSKYLKLLASDSTYSNAQLDDSKVMFRDMPVPTLLKAFFLNKITNKQALDLALKIIHDKTHWYDLSRKIYQHAAKSGLDPEYEIAYMYPVEAAHRLVADLCRNGHTVYIFSNKNSSTMKNLIEKHKKLFIPFKGRVFISGELQQLKPDVDSYETVLKYFDQKGIAREEIVFIESLDEYKDVVEKRFGVAAILWSADQSESIQNILVG